MRDFQKTRESDHEAQRDGCHEQARQQCDGRQGAQSEYGRKRQVEESSNDSVQPGPMIRGESPGIRKKAPSHAENDMSYPVPYVW